MKSLWWLLVLVLGLVFYSLGRLNLQVSNFKVFIFSCLLSVWVGLLIFWLFSPRKFQE
jgi:hypothetical protein